MMNIAGYWQLTPPNTGKRVTLGQVIALTQGSAPETHQCTFLVTVDSVTLQAYDINGVGMPTDGRGWKYAGYGLYKLVVAVGYA